jgi:hypothetical protein
MRCGRNGGKNSRQFYLVDEREIGLQISVALAGDHVLARGFSVARKDFVDHVHAFDDCAEGSETHAVEAGIVSVIDEELRRAGVGAGGGEDDASALVALNNRIIMDFGDFPGLVDVGAGAEPKLHDKTANDAKEGRVGEVAVADQVVKAVCAEGRPVAMDFDDEVARSGGELCLENRWRFGR